MPIGPCNNFSVSGPSTFMYILNYKEKELNDEKTTKNRNIKTKIPNKSKYYSTLIEK